MSCINKQRAHLWSRLTFPTSILQFICFSCLSWRESECNKPIESCVLFCIKPRLLVLQSEGEGSRHFWWLRWTPFPGEVCYYFSKNMAFAAQKGRGTGLWRGCLVIGRSFEAKMLQRHKDNSLPFMWHESTACSLSFVTKQAPSGSLK